MLALQPITFTIVDDVYRPGGPDTTDPTGLTTLEDERYGERFAGTVTCRRPTAIERRITLPAQVETTLRAAGFASFDQAPMPAWEFATAMAFFGTLAPDRPAWLRDDAAGDTKSIAAIVHAYQRALGILDQGNASSGGAGATSSVGS